MSDNVTVVGLQELGAKIDKLVDGITTRGGLRKASNAGAEVFRRELRAKAPVRADKYLKGPKQRKPGYLKKHIGRWTRTNQDGLSVFVGPTKSAFYARFLEFGTGNEPARPFIRPVFDSKADAAAKAFEEELAKQIDGAQK
jgi:HK97 gp10 family phage protein